jgi:ECF sigma factor
MVPITRKRYLYPRRTEHDAKAMGQLTDLLRRVQGGDAGARDALFAAAYAELHALAQGRLRHGGRDTLLKVPRRAGEIPANLPRARTYCREQIRRTCAPLHPLLRRWVIVDPPQTARQ